MKVLDCYRLLPRSNCGRCGAGACMPFAVALSRGEAEPAECPSLSEGARRKLGSAGPQGDWRESLIVELRREVAAVPFAEVAAGLGAALAGEALAIRCLGEDLLVAADGTVTAARQVSPWMRILLLHYVRMRGSAAHAGRWVSFAELRGGRVKASSFAREAEEPLRELFDRDPAAAAEGIRRLGGEPEGGTPAPVAWRVPALPRVPLLLLYWPGEEEYPSRLKVLFDASADRFLDIESLLFLAEGLARRAGLGPDASPHD